MPYILGSMLPENKSVHFGLLKVYGLGKTRISIICKKLGFSYNLKAKNLSVLQLSQISKIVDSLSFLLSNDLEETFFLSKSFCMCSNLFS